jgi:tetratricopeptide (TPR) repeat protein
MGKIDDNGDRVNRIGRIQGIVQEDYDRITGTRDPYIKLNLKPGSDFELVVERYERFYRGENFERLGDDDLTRMALEIRGALGRAMVEIQARKNAQKSGLVPGPDASAHGPRDQAVSRNDVPTAPFPKAETQAASPAPTVVEVANDLRTAIDPDEAAIGDIYYRDGLTFMRLGDYDSACDILLRARDYDPSRGIILANYAYSRFKSRAGDPSVVEQAGADLARAATLDPADAEIFVLMTRFAINSGQAAMAHEAISRLEIVHPGHPRLPKLRARVKAHSA